MYVCITKDNRIMDYKGHLEKGYGKWLDEITLAATYWKCKNVFGSHAHKLAHENLCIK